MGHLQDGHRGLGRARDGVQEAGELNRGVDHRRAEETEILLVDLATNAATLCGHFWAKLTLPSGPDGVAG